ncbi:MAG: thiamine phosphate synthase [Oscillospiraceae bacterium]|nr:thiamine phosphate synthase [Oscillospiraceae bacterium]
MDRHSQRPTPDYSLYLVTDRDLMSCSTIEESVEQAILGGCTVVQLCEKTADSREFYDIAVRVREITTCLGVPLIINDRVDIALAVNADGVHVGQSDLPPEIVRRIIGQDKLVGVSASNLAEALAAVESGADYLGVGAMFATGTKTNANIVSMEELHEIRRKISLPLVVIGGINKETLPLFKGSGIDGIAVVSAVVSQEDIAGAARGLLGQWRNIMLGERR